MACIFLSHSSVDEREAVAPLNWQRRSFLLTETPAQT
jgi:hypothetical protein